MPSVVRQSDWTHSPSERELTAFHEAGHCVATFHAGFDLSTANIRRQKGILGTAGLSRRRCAKLMEELGETSRGRKQLCDLEVAVYLGGMIGEHAREFWHTRTPVDIGRVIDLVERYGAQGDWEDARSLVASVITPPMPGAPHDIRMAYFDVWLEKRFIAWSNRLLSRSPYKVGMVELAKALLVRSTISGGTVRLILQHAMERNGGPPPGHGALQVLVAKARAERRLASRRRQART